MEDRFPIIDILRQTPAIPENCQWAVFLRNHDELTLEMVTDEERDYMYRVYAEDPQARINLGIRRRLAPLLGNDRRRIELMNGLLLLAARHAGHLLRRRDRHGRQHLPRRPQRRAHADAVERRPQRRLLARQPAAALPAGRSSTPSTTTRRVNVEPQQKNPHSLLWWMKRLIAPAQALPGLRPRHDGVPAARRTARSSPSSASYERRAHPRRRQPVALRPVRRAGPLALPGHACRSRCSAGSSSRRSASCPTS